MSGPKFTRRAALRIVAGTAGFIYGTTAQTKAAQSSIRLVLDGMNGITVMYRGQSRTITPQELIEALTPQQEKK